MKYKMLKNQDIKILKTILKGMKPYQRREYFVKIKMGERGVNFPELAAQIKTQPWYMSAMVCGGYVLTKNGKTRWINSNMSPKAVDAVQDILSIDLKPFLNPVEIRRYFTEFPDRIIPEYAERMIKPNRKRG